MSHMRVTVLIILIVAFAPAAAMTAVGAHAPASSDVSAEANSLTVDQSVIESVGVQPVDGSGLQDQEEESDDEEDDNRGGGKSNGNADSESNGNSGSNGNADSESNGNSNSNGNDSSNSNANSDSKNESGDEDKENKGKAKGKNENEDKENKGKAKGKNENEDKENKGKAKGKNENEDKENKGKAKGKNENEDKEKKGKDKESEGEGKAKGKDEEKNENGNERKAKGKEKGKDGDVVVATHGTVISRTVGDASGSNGNAAPSVDFTVSNVTTGRPISLVLSEPTTGNASGTDGDDAASNQSMSVDRLDVTVTNDSDFTMNVTTATDPLDTTPAFEGVNGTESLAHLRVNHSVSDADIENVSFTFRLSQERLTEMETAPENVALYRYHDGEWTELPTEVRNVTAEGVVFEALSPGLSEFAAGAKRPKFKLDGATVSVEKIPEGDTIDVYVTVSNLGSASGRFHADLILDDIIVDSQEVSVAAGGQRRFTFERALDRAGTYEVRVNGLVAGEVTVEAVEAEQNREAYADETTQRSTITPGSLTALDTVRAGSVPLSAGVAFVAGLVVSLLAVARRRHD